MGKKKVILAESPYNDSYLALVVFRNFNVDHSVRLPIADRDLLVINSFFCIFQLNGYILLSCMINNHAAYFTCLKYVNDINRVRIYCEIPYSRKASNETFKWTVWKHLTFLLIFQCIYKCVKNIYKHFGSYLRSIFFRPQRLYIPNIFHRLKHDLSCFPG